MLDCGDSTGVVCAMIIQSAKAIVAGLIVFSGTVSSPAAAQTSPSYSVPSALVVGDTPVDLGFCFQVELGRFSHGPSIARSILFIWRCTSALRKIQPELHLRVKRRSDPEEWGRARGHQCR